jgi:integrase
MTSELTILQPNTANPWLEAARLWLEAAESRRGSLRTRTEYQRNLALFFRFVAKEPDQVTGADCQRWASFMSEAGLSKATINTRLAAVSSFYSFVSTRYEVEPGRYLHNFNPASSVQRLHINPYEKAKGLSPEQARAMLKTCDRSTVLGARDHAILSFYLLTARRRAEVARLIWADLRDGREPGQKEYHYTGKGGKGGWRTLPVPVWASIEHYLKLAGRLMTMEQDTPLFAPTHDKARYLGHQISENSRLSERSINNLVERAAKRAGLEHVTVHTLRHAAAKLRRAVGEDIEGISQFLDHSSLAVTSIYLNTLEGKEDTRWAEVSALLGL